MGKRGTAGKVPEVVKHLVAYLEKKLVITLCLTSRLDTSVTLKNCCSWLRQFSLTCSQNEKVKEDEMGMICSTHGLEDECIEHFGGKGKKKETTRDT
jgi:hypothetical protein